MSLQPFRGFVTGAPAADADPLTDWLDEVQTCPTPARLEGVQVGRLAGWDEAGAPLLEASGFTSGPWPARTTVRLQRGDVGRGVVFLCEGGRPDRPVIVGLLQPPAPAEEATPSAAVEVTVDGKRVGLTATHEIVLRCGEASITLTRAGKVLIKGAYVCSKSTGQNDIKGATVHIN
jgi:hypothetical protein